MIPLLYLRSSSYNTWDFCPQKFFISYTLGMREPGNKKADKGSITHKALELLARQKLAIQQKRKVFEDEELGEKWSVKKFTTDQAVDLAWKCYTKLRPTTHIWTEADLDDCRDWTYKAMTMSQGMFNPLNRIVKWPEKYFDFTIEEPWARYSYKMADGSKIEGYLGLKGTVDLVCEMEDCPGVIELVDWKTGQRKDWATGKVKEWKDLRNDPQLRLYHYALSRVCPEATEIIVTIVFINDGGAYTLDFNRSDLEVTKKILEKRFNLIRNCTRPKLIYPDWKCNRLCHFGKTMFPGTDETICQHIKKETIALGMDRVIQKHGDPEALRAYGDGGGRAAEQRKP